MQWCLSHGQAANAQVSAQSCQSLRCSHTVNVDIDEASDQESAILFHLLAAHARLTCVKRLINLTEDETYHLMPWRGSLN